MSIADFTAMPVSRALEKARSIKLAGRELQIAGRIMSEIVERLQFLNAVGLGYISLDRSAAPLSLEAKASAFVWLRRSVRSCAECFTCSMSRRWPAPS